MTAAPPRYWSRLRAVSFRGKLLLLVVLTSGIALFLASVGFTVYEIVSYRNSTAEKLSVLASIVGNNCVAALSFDDPGTAAEVLAALRFEKNILDARILNRENRLFASYTRADRSREAMPGIRPAGTYFEGERLRVYRTITFQGETLGTVYLCTDLGELTRRLYRYMAMALAIAVLSSAVSALLARRLQQAISQPILQLVDTARQVSQRHDYAIRARKVSEDELGVLVDGFNDMLAQIQRQNADLRRAHDELEARVRERTRDLEQEVGERRRAEEDLRRTAEELTRSNRELQQFAYVASHDLQEPLRKVQAFGERLEAKYGQALDERGTDYLARMRAAALRMQVLINDLLSYARVTTRAQPFETVDLNRVVQGVIGDLEIRLEHSGGRVDAGALPVLQADRTQMRQLFQNLLSNGLKYARPEVPPVLTVAATAVTLDGERPGWEIAITDNGIGFETAHAERIFGVFQRLHGRTEYEGSGVGLAICRKIVERHRGTIRAAGRPGGGATFTVYLPAAAGAPAPEGAGATPPA